MDEVAAPVGVVWVEILSRHRDVLARHRCVGGEIRIGRAYANDVVVDDPYVAPEHVRIVRDHAGAFVAEKLDGSLFEERGRQPRERIVLDGNHPIRIGHTYLRIRDAGHVVPAARANLPARRWPLLVALAAAILGIEALSTWQHETAEPKLLYYLEPLLRVCVFVVVWTAGWAVLTRIFSKEARFERTLLIALSGLLAFSLYNEVCSYVVFALSWRSVAIYQYVGMWVILAAACLLHLREIGPALLPLKGGVLALLAGIAIAMQTVKQSDSSGNDVQNASGAGLLPPALRLRPLQTEDAFFAEVEQLKGKLDKARAEDPP